MRIKYQPVICTMITCILAGGALGIDPGSIDEEIAATYGKPDARKALEMRCVDVLKKAEPNAEMERACRILQKIGTVDSIDALARLLPDKRLSHWARTALEPMPYPQAGRALRDALSKTSGLTKVGIIHSLGVRRDVEAVELLIPLLSDPDKQVAAAAAWALGRTASPRGLAALAQLRQRSAVGTRQAGPGPWTPTELRAVAADASLLAAEQLVKQGKLAEAARIYRELEGSTWPKHVRMGAFAGLLVAEPDRVVARLAKAIKSTDATVRGLAIQKVATLKNEGLAKRFAQELQALPPQTQVLLIGALAGRPEKAVVRPAIAAAATSRDPAVRLAAVEALGDVGDASSVKLLARIIAQASNDQEVKTAAASLRRIRADRVDGQIIRCLEEAEPGDRAVLIGILRDRQARAAVPALLKEAATGDEAARKAAFKALADLAGPEDLPALVKLLIQLKTEQLRSDAERAVAMVAKRIKDEARRGRAVLTALREEKTLLTQAKCSLLRVLQGIGTPECFEAVRQAVADRKAAVRDAAVRALADWPDDRALEALLQVFRATDNRTLRIVALRGCVRLLGLGSRPPAETLKVCDELLRGAHRPEEKRLVLARLAGVGDADALKLIEPLLKDQQVKAEAELAMIGVARALVSSSPQDALAAARTLQQHSASEDVRKQAASVIKLIERLEDYITTWQLSGPYTKKGQGFETLQDSPFAPEQDGAKVSWRPLTPMLQGDRPWMLNLGAAIGGQNRAAYVRTWVYSPLDQGVRLEFGTDDGNKVWLNGKLIHASPAPGPATPGEHKVNARLKKGWNLLMLKITQDTGPWEFCLRIRGPKGEKLQGLKVEASPETT